MTRTLSDLVLRVALAAFAALACAGCLVSTFHPLYDEASLVVDDGLAGSWENTDSQVTVNVFRSEWRSYEIAFTERSTTMRFTGYLTDIGGVRFLSVRPLDGEERSPFLVVTNGPLQIVRNGNQVRIRALDYDEVAKQLAAGTLGVAAATDLKQNVVITAETPLLRKWMASIRQDSPLWAEWKELSRQ